MKRFTALFVLAIIVTGFASGQQRETRNLRGFDRVSFGIAGNLIIKFGPEFNVVLEGNQRDLEEVVTEISGDKLIIKQESWRFRSEDKVMVTITMPEITGLSVSGSGNAEITDDINDADDLDLSVSGSGKIITAGIVVDEFNCSISGSGDVIIGSGGEADRGEISISGSGGYRGEDFEIDHLAVRVSGSGSCFCKAGDSLQASISGSGNVTYKGDPRIDARVSGSGKVRSAQ
ncbi:MAG TPA: head GIN domain-containing protein [Bacteroidales bacterium]|nr:head GIN domain-containing protein [Bacteroidales bacterium]